MLEGEEVNSIRPRERSLPDPFPPPQTLYTGLFYMDNLGIWRIGTNKKTNIPNLLKVAFRPIGVDLAQLKAWLRNT
jgi:hypothetical protein